MKRPRYLHWVVYGCVVLLIGIAVTVWTQHPHGLVAGVIGAVYSLYLAVQNKRRQSVYDWAKENPEEARRWIEENGAR